MLDGTVSRRAGLAIITAVVVVVGTLLVALWLSGMTIPLRPVTQEEEIEATGALLDTLVGR